MIILKRFIHQTIFDTFTRTGLPGITHDFGYLGFAVIDSFSITSDNLMQTILSLLSSKKNLTCDIRFFDLSVSLFPSPSSPLFYLYSTRDPSFCIISFTCKRFPTVDLQGFQFFLQVFAGFLFIE